MFKGNKDVVRKCEDKLWKKRGDTKEMGMVVEAWMRTVESGE